MVSTAFMRHPKLDGAWPADERGQAAIERTATAAYPPTSVRSVEDRSADAAGGAAPPETPASKRRARVLLTLKVLVTAAALGLTFSRLSFADLSAAVRRISLLVVLSASAVSLANLGLGGVRWRVLLAAYGAKRAPGIPFLARAQLVGHCYNTLIPGQVTGDLVRAHATRQAFDGPLASYMIVAIERIFGLAGLLTVGAVALLLHPLPGVVRADWLAGLAVVAAIAILLIPIAARKIGRFLPGPLARWATSLPVPTRPGWLGVAFVLSILGHVLVAVTGHLLVNAVAPEVLASESFVLVPLVTIATYFPFAIAGLGVREAAFVFLFGKIGIGAAEATAASLGLMAVYALLAALGGLVHLIRPLEAPAAARPTSS
jgi:uncharacterized membrane protein YbhN (UPF0104 family)